MFASYPTGSLGSLLQIPGFAEVADNVRHGQDTLQLLISIHNPDAMRLCRQQLLHHRAHRRCARRLKDRIAILPATLQSLLRQRQRDEIGTGQPQAIKSVVLQDKLCHVSAHKASRVGTRTSAIEMLPIRRSFWSTTGMLETPYSLIRPSASSTVVFATHSLDPWHTATTGDADNGALPKPDFLERLALGLPKHLPLGEEEADDVRLGQ